MMTFKELAVVWCGITSIYKENRDGSNRPDHTIEKCVEQFGHDAVAETLATVVRLKPWDGRIGAWNREWANGVEVNPKAVVHDENNGFLRRTFRVDGKPIMVDVDAIHMSHVDQLVTELRKIKEA